MPRCPQPTSDLATAQPHAADSACRAAPCRRCLLDCAYCEQLSGIRAHGKRAFSLDSGQPVSLQPEFTMCTTAASLVARRLLPRAVQSIFVAVLATASIGVL